MPSPFGSTLNGIVTAVVTDLPPAFKRLCSLFVRHRTRQYRKKWGPARKGKKWAPMPKHQTCAVIDHPSFKKPDPMIYDQYYLMSQGVAVTWQNPDIALLQNGVPVLSSDELQPNTTYTIQARIYNASTTGVVYDMPVTFSYLSFGVGVLSNTIPGPLPIVSLGVKGSAGGVAVAEMQWTTPPEAGHYCLQVSFACIDDANPFNNLGQHNTQVVKASSPAQLKFRLRNTDAEARQFRFEVDTYQIQPPPRCSDWAPHENDRRVRNGQLSAATLARNSRADNPLPAGWSILFNPAGPVLQPDEEITIAAVVSPAVDFHGQQPINVHVYSGKALIGGVTAIVEQE
jgi:hypothetical protein